MHSKTFTIVAVLFTAALYFCGPPVQAVNVLTEHNDNARSGVNLLETTLTTANVNSTNFGVLFTNAVDGNFVFTQPLYVQGLTISNGTHNVVFVGTESNSVYAFDADTVGITYWHTNLGVPLSFGCTPSPIVGITGTPVIDLTTGTLYVDARMSNDDNTLHALDITNGSEKFGGPVTITASQFGTTELQRPGLLELSNVIYIAYGSECYSATHGFVLGYNATNLTQLYAFNDTPTGSKGAIWSSGMGPAADTNGNIYIMTGNGTFDGTNNFGESMLKLSSSLQLLDWATPTNYALLNSNDTDFGSGGAVVLPGGYVVGSGKDGNLYMANVTNMGHLGNFAQQFSAATEGDVVGPSPVYWAGPGTNFIFLEHPNSVTKSYAFTGTNINTTALGASSLTVGDKGGGIALSANGTNNGILWEIDSDTNLRAYDAAHFPMLLWHGSVGAYQKENCPTIANGKVYVATPSSLVVLGLSNAPPSITTQPASQTNYVGQTNTFTVGANGTAPLSYQWKVDVNGSYVNLSAGGQFSGVTSATLSISSLVATNATNYEVVVTNAYGTVTSAAVTLTVLANPSSYQTVILGDHPVSFWPLNETNGTVIHDIAGTNNGTAINTNYLRYGDPGVTYSNNTNDTAIYFTNTGDPYISVPYSTNLNTTNFSAEVWLDMPTFPANAQSASESPMTFGNGNNPTGWVFQIQIANASNPNLYGWCAKNSSVWNSANSGTAIQAKWSYYVMTFNGSTLTVYTNGVSAASTSVTSYNMPGSGEYLFMGAYNDGVNSPDSFRYYQGGMENVAVYNYALTLSQITNHYYYGTNYSAPSGTAPSISSQPASTTNYATQTATFSVTASGTAPLAYQWKVDVNGSYVNLSNVGQFSGVTTATLTISNLVATNATNYEVVVTNAFGTVTSAAATLTVLPAAPSITTQPANATKTVGQTATFSVVAAGLPPLSYQWKVDVNGSYANLANAGQFSGVTTATLTISNLVLTNATNYEVVVTNTSGSVTSSAATLTVNSAANYQSIVLADAPVSYWPMQETNGPTIKDIVTTNAGPFNGTVQVSTDGFSNGGTDGDGKSWGIIHETFTNSTSTVATDGATFLFGGPGGLAGMSGDTAVYFTNLNGQSNSVQIAMGTNGTGVYESQLDSSTFTVEAWIKVPTYTIGWTSNTYQIPLSLNAYGNSGNTANGWFMGVKTDGSGSGAYGEMFFEAGTGSAFTSNGPSAQIFSGKWVYAVQEYNGTATVIYTNGTLMVSNTQTYQPLSHSSTHEEPLIIGSECAYYFNGSGFSGNTRADFWDGGVSHVAYYNYALSASHITNHYYYGTNSSFAGAFRAPVAPAFKPAVGATLTPTLVSGSSANQFQMQVNAVANQNYTLQMCTDLSSGQWVSLYTTNSTTNTTFVLTDPQATNKQRFYRVLIGP